MATETMPEFATVDMMEFLDVLRETGVTNMFGAAPYLQDEFPELDKKQAREVVAYWMHTFSERHKDR